MTLNWDNAFAKEQLWSLREVEETLDSQLSSCRMESSYSNVSEESDTLHDTAGANINPNVLIPEKLQETKHAIITKLNKFLLHRLGFILDFSESVIGENNSFQFEDENSLQMQIDRAKLQAIADLSANLELPRDLNQYSFLTVFMVGLVKYINDLEYTRRVDAKIIPPNPQYQQNSYDKLRYRFHRYKMQHAFATRHPSMQKYNCIREIGKNLLDEKFLEINTKSEHYIYQFMQLAKTEDNIAVRDQEEQRIYQECRQFHTANLNKWLSLFGIKVSRFQRNPTDPVEDHSAWTAGDNVVGAQSASGPVESENSAYLNAESGDEVPLNFPRERDDGLPFSPDQEYSSSDSESEDANNIGDYLDDPLLSWLTPRKRPRLGN